MSAETLKKTELEVSETLSSKLAPLHHCDPRWQNEQSNVTSLVRALESLLKKMGDKGKPKMAPHLVCNETLQKASTTRIFAILLAHCQLEPSEGMSSEKSGCQGLAGWPGNSAAWLRVAQGDKKNKCFLTTGTGLILSANRVLHWCLSVPLLHYLHSIDPQRFEHYTRNGSTAAGDRIRAIPYYLNPRTAQHCQTVGPVVSPRRATTALALCIANKIPAGHAMTLSAARSRRAAR